MNKNTTKVQAAARRVTGLALTTNLRHKRKHVEAAFENYRLMVHQQEMRKARVRLICRTPKSPDWARTGAKVLIPEYVVRSYELEPIWPCDSTKHYVGKLCTVDEHGGDQENMILAVRVRRDGKWVTISCHHSHLIPVIK